MLGIVNPERTLHRSRSEIFSLSPRYLSPSRPSAIAATTAAAAAAAAAAATATAESPRMRSRRGSLPGALSLTEAYNVMAVDVSFFGTFSFSLC